MCCNESIQYNTIQCNAIQYNIIQYNTIQCNTIQYNAIQCNTMQCNTIQCNTIQYNAIQYNAIQCNTMPCNTIQYPKINLLSTLRTPFSLWLFPRRRHRAQTLGSLALQPEVLAIKCPREVLPRALPPAKSL